MSVTEEYSNDSKAYVCVYVNGASEKYGCGVVNRDSADLVNSTNYNAVVGNRLTGIVNSVFIQDFPLLYDEFR